MSLYLKYRPGNVEELDLEHVRQALGQIVKKGELSHAYLFDGPRGSGKTSSARILAKIANCEENEGIGEPCGECGACLAIEKGSAVDLVEIDAASNRGIDDIRELKQKIKLAPSSFRKKVYIIDEVHMLTKQAFNALLKTLEEPPEHALFVLCTTEPQRLPETIVSRCTRLKFKKAGKEEMLRSLRRVVEGEKIKIEKESLEFLAGQVDGSFRDGVKVLDQAGNENKKVTREVIEEVLYGVSGYSPDDFVQAMLEREVKSGLEIVREAEGSGLDMGHFLRSAMYMVRDGMLNSLGVLRDRDLNLKVGREGLVLVRKMDEVLSRLKSSSTPSLLVEMTVIDWCGVKESKNSKVKSKNEGKVKSSSSVDSASASSGVDKKEKEEEEEEEKEGKFSKIKKGKKDTKNLSSKKANGKTNGKAGKKVELKLKEVKTGWRKCLKRVNGNYSLETLLSSAELGGLQGDTLVVKVAYAFHKKQLESSRFYGEVKDLIEDVYGQRLNLRFVIQSKNAKVKSKKGEESKNAKVKSPTSSAKGTLSRVNKKEKKEKEEDELVEAAEEIFGG